ncbi:Non-repetitive/WGA-negative nucleoporin C-terminal-domain-containing protein [Aspergillus avenaceus]|uniref:Non-repetitive/WGA-negative nucleoporin C-terminal-domain-containing protein n=1 Tax=Aspergillus avenaceus TaxID=36643 RepID=A0A5N6TE19_ASPAV|nr:Non-repetitive/WGA-negative nucleoporin C-terminal-domain-containing protein [Aspergillus avenaceus]
MFVPKAALSSTTSLRNPRRRQRTSSDESVKPPNAKRQRSALRQGSCDLRTNDLGDNQEPSSQLIPATLNNINSTAPENVILQDNMPIRGPKRTEREDDYSDGTLVLSKTDFYSVVQLPTLPDQIRGLHSGSFRCFFGTNNSSYALAVTRTRAIIWPYSFPASSPSPSDVFTLPIPESSTEQNESIPFGVLLAAATGGVPGLLLVTPDTGNIIYWETVSSAASLGLGRQKEKGIYASIPNLLSGEHVLDVVNAEPSGVIVTLSSGRVAHVTVRDPQGKPTITANFLRNSPGSSKVGFLSGIRSVLGGGFSRKDLAAVRIGESRQRGQRDIIIATSGGLFEIWDTHWNNGSVLKKQFDITDDLCNYFGQQQLSGDGDSSFKILDFSLTPACNSQEAQAVATEPSWQLSLIVTLPGLSAQSVSVVQINLADAVTILSSHTVELHCTSTDGTSKPRLLIPKPGDTAFIVMDNFVSLLSLIPVRRLSPSRSSLESEPQPHLFYDSINFRTGRAYEILGCGFEDKGVDNPYPACLVMVRDFGIVRVTALPHQADDKTSKDAQVSAKSKIEQAVFYGTMLGNPLNLTNRGSLDFPVKEIEQAALDICRELLQSRSQFIPTTAISIDQNLRARAKALDDLAYLLKQHNKVLEQRAWWELLWGAEKLAAQRTMWKLEEDSRKSKDKRRSFLAHVVDLMGEKFRTKPETRDGEVDPVRAWFLYDTFRMEHIVPWIFNAIKPQKGHSSRQPRRVSEQMLEASELSLAVLETAFRYRDEHATQYGITDGYIEDGVLVSGFENLPEFWTSQRISYIEMGHLLDLELDSCRAWIQQTKSVSEAPESLTVKKLSGNSARQLHVLSQMHCERVRWLSVQEDQKLIDEGLATEQAHIKRRKWQLFKLAGIERLEDAIILAEKCRDMGALVELIIELQDQTKSEIFPPRPLGNSPGLDSCESEHLSRKISLYFEKFGESWADAFFSRQISMHQSGILFAMRKFQPFITRFLRKDAVYSRLSWINDVIGEKDYNAAAQSLEKLALGDETDLWSHRVELSLAKLGKLATCEDMALPDHTTLHSGIRKLEDLSELDAVQEAVYSYISPVLQGAIDQKAEIDLAVDHFGKAIAQERPSLHELLTESIANIVSRQLVDMGQLVDILTLMDVGQVSEYVQHDFYGKEFYFALCAIRIGNSVQQNSFGLIPLQKLVWRRCMIKDNWVAMGKAAEEIDNDAERTLFDTVLFRTLSLCLKDRLDDDINHQPLYIPSSPYDVLLSEADSGLLLSRFRPEQRARIIHDIEKENEILHQHIEGGKLEYWFKNLKASAEVTSPAIISAAENESTNKEQAEQLTQSIHEPSTKARLSWL